MASQLGKIIADFSTTLAASVSASATSASIQSATDDDAVTLPAGVYYFAIDGDNSQKEYIKCSLSGTALTSIQSVSRQGALTSGFARAHRVGASVTLTNFAQLLLLTKLLNGETDLDSTDPLKYDGTATLTDDNHLATKKYADDLAIAGSPDASTSVKGISKLSTAPASASNPIAVGDNDPRVPTADENNALAGTGTPSASNPYISLSTLSGAIALWATGSAPTGWLLCDGSAVSRATYAALFAIIGTTYGSGDGSTTFNLPNLKGRVPVGLDSAQTEFDTIAETGGAKTHTLTTGEMPAHTHDFTAAAPGSGGAGGSATLGQSGTVTTTSAGGGGAHNNLQPYIVLNYIIKT